MVTEKKTLKKLSLVWFRTEIGQILQILFLREILIFPFHQSDIFIWTSNNPWQQAWFEMPGKGKIPLTFELLWFHVFNFSPLCVFNWKMWNTRKREIPLKFVLYWLHLFNSSPCVFSNVSSNQIPGKGRYHWSLFYIDCILHWLHLINFFLHCVFSNVFSNEIKYQEKGRFHWSL